MSVIPFDDEAERRVVAERGVVVREHVRDERLDAEDVDATVRAAQKEAEKLGILPQQGKDDIGSMFEDVYAEVPWHLAEQRDLALAESGKEPR